MIIDEERINVLTGFATLNGIKTKIESDHNLLWCYVKLKWNPQKKSNNRIEIYNFKCPEGLRKFNELTSENTIEKCFDGNENFSKKAENWFKTLINIIKRCFKKIRIANRRPKSDSLSKLMLSREILKKKIKNNKNPITKQSDEIILAEIEETISEKCSEKILKLSKIM